MTKDKLIKKMKTSPRNISPDEIEKMLGWLNFDKRKTMQVVIKLLKENLMEKFLTWF